MQLTRSQVIAAFFLVIASACARNPGPSVEVWHDGAHERLTVAAYTIEGKRDGAVTQAVATFTLAGGDHVRVSFEIVYNPTPALGNASWSADGENAGAGTVRSESVRFLGGQGEGPSLGGRFLLESDGAARFRVVLPLRPVSQNDWSAD
jgi:hypothetical protein